VARLFEIFWKKTPPLSSIKDARRLTGQRSGKPQIPLPTQAKKNLPNPFAAFGVQNNLGCKVNIARDSMCMVAFSRKPSKKNEEMALADHPL
jgi:hypothetical protein